MPALELLEPGAVPFSLNTIPVKCRRCGLEKSEDEYRIAWNEHGKAVRSDRVCRECLAAKQRLSRKNRTYKSKVDKNYFCMERKTVLVIYDLVRYLVMEGKPVGRHAFIDVMHRAACGRCSTDKCEAKRKEILSRLTPEACKAGEPEPGEAERYLRMILEKSEPDRRKCKSSYVAKDRTFERMKNYMRLMGINVMASFKYDELLGKCLAEIFIENPSRWMTILERLLVSDQLKANYKFRKREIKLVKPQSNSIPRSVKPVGGWRVLFGSNLKACQSVK